MAAELELRDASVEISGKRLLDDVSLTVREGEFVALIGPNGAGKTTLLRAALGLMPASGDVLLNGKPVRAYNGRARAGLIAWLPQQALITEALTALDLVAGARFRFDESRRSAEAAAREALQRAGAEQFEKRFVNTLSGGEQQRVAVAAMLAQEAPLLLLDEPANHLDPGQQIALYRLFGELWRQGKGVLCITHDVNLLAHAGQGVTVAGLREGKLKFQQPFESPDLPEKLQALFNTPFTAIATEGRRALLAGVAPQ